MTVNPAQAPPQISPDRDTMRAHVEHLFGGDLHGHEAGLIELAWTDPFPDKKTGRHRLRHAHLFRVDQIDELVDMAANLNANPDVNTYIAPWLRRPDTAPFGRCEDKDAWACFAVYTDLDDEGSAAGAKDHYAGYVPTWITVTGRDPHPRAQLFWRLEEPLTDHAAGEATMRGLAAAFSGDDSICNPSRVMRLAGSIAWPLKPGRVVELTARAPIRAPGKAAYALDDLRAAFPATTRQPAQASNVTPLRGGSLGLGQIKDGRERYMRDTVLACLIEYMGTNGTEPTPQELFDFAWPQYQRNVDLSRPGRGPEECLEKCANVIRRFADGKISGVGAIEDAIAIWEGKARRGTTLTVSEAATDGIYEYLDIGQIKNMPDPKWLVDGLVVERGLGFIYGPPGCLKTFIALDMALSFTTGQGKWWGRDVQHSGAVIYISCEGQADLKFRIMAWEQHRGVKSDDSPFYLIRQTMNFMKPEDVGKLIKTVQDIADKTNGPIAAVFVDTVSRVLPGAEENLQKDMTLFIAACDAVQQRFNTTVIGLHHTSRNGNMRGSTVMPGAGDFIVEVRREPGADTGSIFAFKIKSGEDGWEQHFKVETVHIDGRVAQTSLVVDPIDAQPKKEAGSGWPDKDICRQILAAIDEQWTTGKPWCFAPNSSRAAVPNIVKRWHLKRDVVADILITWTANGVVCEDVRDPKNHITGYRKMADI